MCFVPSDGQGGGDLFGAITKRLTERPTTVSTGGAVMPAFGNVAQVATDDGNLLRRLVIGHVGRMAPKVREAGLGTSVEPKQIGTLTKKGTGEA